MRHIPLFPLKTVLFPYARMPLQIFEARYMDMITTCMKSGDSFGVVRICEGNEALLPDEPQSLDIDFMGTEARIVDFDGLPNNRLKITIEGGQCFRVNNTSVAKNGLISADIDYLPLPAALPLDDQYLMLVDVLKDLLKYPAVKALAYQLDLDDMVRSAYQLSSVLPIDNLMKQELLELDSVGHRLAMLKQIIEQLQA